MDQEVQNNMNRFFNFLANISVARKLNIIVAILVLGLLGAFLLELNGLRINQIFAEASSAQISDSSVATNQLSELLLRIQSSYDVILNPDITKAYKESLIETKSNAILAAQDIIENYETNILSTNSTAISSLAQTRTQTSDLANLQEQEYAAFLSVREAFRNLQRTDQQFQEVYESDGRYDVFSSSLTSNLKSMQQELHSLVAVNDKLADTYHLESASSYQGTVNILGLAMVTTVVATWFIANAIMRSISRRLVNLELFAQSVEQNYADLRYEYEVEGQDEIASLGNAYNRMTIQLRTALIGLEGRVKERTAELAISKDESEQRARQFEAITLVSAAISSIRSIEELLPRVTNLISQQFGYYHVGIFLNDDINENAILSAANSEGGKRMLDRGHQLKIGEQGIVGYVTSTGNPRIALDVGGDAVYFDNPDLPDTRSEMALPLTIGEDIVGALDVQSIEESAFSESDINVLSLLAEQVSRAIENARLFDQARISLAESEALYRQYLRQAWNRLPKEQNLAGFRYNSRGTFPIEVSPKTVDEANEGTLDTLEEKRSLSVPISIRGETLGSLSIQIPDEEIIDEDQLDLIHAVAERVAFSAENARLFEEITRRAERERLVSDITVKIRNTNNPDAMIQTALAELKTALGATKVELVPHTLEKEKITSQPNSIPASNSKVSHKETKQASSKN